MMDKILYIEDEAFLRENVVEELEDEGYEVYQACDGQEGLEKIVELKPNLVLCDITMPRKDGYQVLKELRGKYPLFAEMPFIFISALADKDRVLAGLKTGADGYLTKPIDFEVMLSTVQASLRQIGRIKKNHNEVFVLNI